MHSYGVRYFQVGFLYHKSSWFKCIPLSQLSYLKCLYMRLMVDLEYMTEKDISEEAAASSTTSSTLFFPSLKSLEVYKCYNLKGWWRSTSTLAHHQHQSLPSFPCLSFLKIESCSQLVSMPLFPFLEEELYLLGGSLKPLQQTMAMAPLPPSSTTSTFSPLPKLKCMNLYCIKDQVSLADE